ncbi:uncharacterized protein VTP21DRAFT_1770 [Calcarisporiella thermophila]|uniref:uncharacterized protein n=1 Tax=Calcarisporiella thermophila TaxID=911321 RepID=UPI0037427457
MSACTHNKRALFFAYLDKLFLIYFVSHIPITMIMDLQALYPPHLVPSALKELSLWYIKTFRDPFMSGVAEGGFYWFLSFLYCEAIYQLPFFFWATWAIWTDYPKRHLPLLVYGTHTSTTVIPVLFEVVFNPAHNLLFKEIAVLLSFYTPYLVIPLILAAVSYTRANRVQEKVEKVE